MSRLHALRAGTGGNRNRADSPFTPNKWEPAKKVRCTFGNGTVPGTCGNGYVTQTERHHPCGGTGRLRCQMCNRTGYR
jgi:hypothetical protein